MLYLTPHMNCLSTEDAWSHLRAFTLEDYIREVLLNFVSV